MVVDFESEIKELEDFKPESLMRREYSDSEDRQENILRPQHLEDFQGQQEIKDNLTRMLQATDGLAGHQRVVAGAPGIPAEYYAQFLSGTDAVVVYGQTYRLLQQARAALVTSGTATLETALFRVPQVVCYYIRWGRLVSFLRRHLLKVKYISLVNLIADAEVVRELVADGMTVENVRRELTRLLDDEAAVATMQRGYAQVAARLGKPGAPRRAAREICSLLKK